MNDKKDQKRIGVAIVIIGLVAVAYFIGQNSNSSTQKFTNIQPNTISTERETSPKTSADQIQQQAQIPQPNYPRYYTPTTFSANAEAQRNSFVNGCTSSSNTWGKCNCGFDYLIHNYGVIWLIQENAYVNVNGVASPELRSASLDAYKSCSVFSN